MHLRFTLLILFTSGIAWCQIESVQSTRLSFFGSTRNHVYSTPQKKLLVKDHLMFTTYSLQLLGGEKEIFEVEAQECTANLRRDTITLRNLWSRDFTADEPLKGLVTGKNSLPYYVSFTRMVENFTQKEDMVYTSGYEIVQPLKPDAKLEEPSKRNFYHTWIKRGGGWILVAKSHSQTD